MAPSRSKSWGIADPSLNSQDRVAMINQADDDGNGSIELPEYLAQLAREDREEEEAQF